MTGFTAHGRPRTDGHWRSRITTSAIVLAIGALPTLIGLGALALLGAL